MLFVLSTRTCGDCMGLIIADNHPVYTLKEAIDKATQPFFQTMGFNYFQYLRCFNDGSISYLTTHPELFDIMRSESRHQKPLVFSAFSKEQQNAHSFWFLWDEALPDEPVTMAREKLNICHGVTFVRRAKDYYDMIAFAVPKELDRVGTFYLNKLKAMEDFIHQFDLQCKDLIMLSDKHAIALPPPNRDLNYQNLCLQTGRVLVQGRDAQAHITAQELNCLRLLSHGDSMKEVAKKMQVSPRTIETYLLRIKQRTGWQTRAELEKMLCTY